MTITEQIIWEAETKEDIKRTHPDWTLQQQDKYFEAVKDILTVRGFFD